MVPSGTIFVVAAADYSIRANDMTEDWQDWDLLRELFVQQYPPLTPSIPYSRNCIACIHLMRTIFFVSDE